MTPHDEELALHLYFSFLLMFDLIFINVLFPPMFHVTKLRMQSTIITFFMFSDRKETFPRDEEPDNALNWVGSKFIFEQNLKNLKK